MGEGERLPAERAELECEKGWVFALMMFTGGFYGAYTYTVRGGVFCNAQTANFVLFAMALGNAQWAKAGYYLIPMGAYLLGAVISEAAAGPFRRMGPMRWDTFLVGFEILVVLILGFLPETMPHQVSQVAINFICSMQYNTFRQTRGIPMATTFCTNHVRQLGISIVKVCHHPENAKARRKLLTHLGMLAVFTAGGVLSAVLCRFLLGRAIWGALLPLGIVFFDLLHADRHQERNARDRIPKGH